MGLKIVVIDDHTGLPETLRYLLPAYIEGCEVLTRKPDKLKDLPSEVDVFIVDYRMKPLGPVVVRALKTSHPNARVIIWSMAMDVSMDVVKKESMEAGADVAILKDINVEQMAELIISLVWG